MRQQLAALWAVVLVVGAASTLSIHRFLRQYNPDYFSGASDAVDAAHRRTAAVVNESSSGFDRLPRDEFLHHKPSAREVDDFFFFDKNTSFHRYAVMGAKEAIKPLWNCRGPRSDLLRRQQKLQYIQIPMTGDTLLRTLLRGYAQTCQIGLDAASHCVDLGLEFMAGPYQWVNGRGSTRAGDVCTLSYMIKRGTGEIVNDPDSLNQTVLSSSYIQDNADVLAGHVSIGADRYWFHPQSGFAQNKENRRVRVRSVVFLRHPVYKFVNDMLTLYRLLEPSNQTLSVSKGIRIISGAIKYSRGNNTQNPKYLEKYAPYLITPEQKFFVENEGIFWTPEQRTRLAMRNLLEYNVVVAITERWVESLNIIAQLIDADSNVTRLFDRISEPNLVRTVIGNANGTTAVNGPPQARLLPTDTAGLADAIVAEMSRAPEWRSMWAQLVDLVRFDMEIYELGTRIHREQYRQLSEQINSTPR
jgi:hypothetical protein